ncbi:Hypothetical predicted protein [Mytilus galloprovincialis]|uniref:RNase H type-1 domain-containing protein n=1 Tax=Mytilus galloprovincialis TaxID=29158 RepID=A0A8B6DD35_MYTGA|nr:Hypothetical predicted protein [Mytilus galloprovincialis]
MWALHLEKWNGKCIISPNPDLIIESDASSKQGWGAVDVAQNIRMGGPWDETEKALHINALELKAAEFGLKSLTKDKTDIHVHLKMDNVSAVAHINRMGGTRSPILLKINRARYGNIAYKGE